MMAGNTLLAIGEALIDFIPAQTGCDFDAVESFSPRVGGAPANVCGAFARLGGRAALLTQLGDDPFGRKIARELEGFGVSTRYIPFTDAANTALAFVSLGADGGRTFSFYRNPSADLLYAPDQLRDEAFRDLFALHFCSVALVESPMRRTHEAAIARAAALVPGPPSASRPAASASMIFFAVGRKRDMAGHWSESPSATASSITLSRLSNSASSSACGLPSSAAS